jgi:four helix bundle protein
LETHLCDAIVRSADWRGLVGDFRKLQVWRFAHELTRSIYRLTADFPQSELYGLTSQMRRAASSIPANLAEGCGRQGDRELSRFARISLGSATELEYYLLLTEELGLERTPAPEVRRLLHQVQAMLHGLLRSLLAERGKQSS